MRFQSQALNSGRSGRPVFFLPPHGAGGVEYYAFRHFFAAVQVPLFSFDAIYSGQDRLEEWVEGLFQEIARLSAGGGCRLLGWGHGAVLAPLVGERLRKAQIPTLLLLFDPVPPTGYTRLDHLKAWIRTRLMALPAVALECTRWARGLCGARHLLAFCAAQLIYGYWLAPRLHAQQRTRHFLSPGAIYAARRAFRTGTAAYVPRACDLETCLLLSRNRRQRHSQWRPYLSNVQLCALERSCHDFSPRGLTPLAEWLNRLPQ